MRWKVLVWPVLAQETAVNPSTKTDKPLEWAVGFFFGNVELSLELWTVIAGISGYPLRRVGSGKRMTLTHSGEQWLDDWMTENAFVCWLEHQAPWEFEDELLSSPSLPLNIKGNRDHPFARVLTEARIQAIKSAREWPIAVESNQRRKSIE